jgi:hypothetical protein
MQHSIPILVNVFLDFLEKDSSPPEGAASLFFSCIPHFQNRLRDAEKKRQKICMVIFWAFSFLQWDNPRGYPCKEKSQSLQAHTLPPQHPTPPAGGRYFYWVK